ncbi:MAG TPA: CHASE domain-containing protein, partial [Rhodocyclaceae bacterium]|nr:CHASE domain-containing protein [Rhodocyclaceae bacterium]
MVLSRAFFAPVAGLVVALALGVAGEQGFELERGRIEQDQRSQVVTAVGQYRAALEGELNATLYLTNGLVAYVETHSAPVAEQVEPLLKALYEQGRHIRNIGLAPGNRLTYVYPRRGNEQAVGLYYPDLPDQWPVVERTIRERQPRLAGPVQLRQGGQGLIYRVPVFIGPKADYWGLLSMVIDPDSLFAWVGIAPEANGLQLAVRGKDGAGRQGDTFLGDAALFESDAVTATVSTPGGTWQIAA